MSQPDSSRLLEFLEEDNGSLSATRLAFLLWAVGVLIVWGVDSIRSKVLQPIDGDIATILGILMTGKVVQKFGEKPGNDQTPAEQNTDNKVPVKKNTPG